MAGETGNYASLNNTFKELGLEPLQVKPVNMNNVSTYNPLNAQQGDQWGGFLDSYGTKFDSAGGALGGQSTGSQQNWWQNLWGTNMDTSNPDMMQAQAMSSNAKWGGINAGLNAVMGLGNMYFANQALRQGKKELKFQKEAFREQLDISKKQYNREIEERARRKSSMANKGKVDEASISEYMDKHGV